MNRIKTEMQTKLVNALKIVPKQHEVNNQEYLSLLMGNLKNFQCEVEWNIYKRNSYGFSLEYLKKLITDFTLLYMTTEGTVDIVLFPEIINSCETLKMSRIKTCVDLHKFIYLKTISMLQNRESLVDKKIQFKIPIVEKDELAMSKYVLKEKNIMYVIEVGYSVYQSDILANRSGEEMHLYQFIKDFGAFVGMEVNNVKQRIEEMKNRCNRHKYLDRLILILENM
jgi:hypothetical protein